MRNLSSEFIEKVNSGKDVYYLKYAEITLSDGTKILLDNSNFWSNGFSFEDSVSSNETFDIGSAIINKFTLTINNIDDNYTDYVFEGAEAIVWVGLELSTGIEKIRICTGTIAEEPKQRSSILNLTFYDNMAKFDRDYADVTTTFPATRGQIVRDICSKCGVTLQTTTFENDNYLVQSRPDDDNLTCRQMLAWVSQIGCQWAKCDEYGRLVVGWYDTEISEENSIKIKSNSGSPTINLDDVVITGVKVTEYEDVSSNDEESKSYQYGTDGYVLEISENKLISAGTGRTISSMIGERCVGMRFRPFSSTFITDISIESGDPVIIKDGKGNSYESYITSLVLRPGNFEQASCGAKSAARNKSKQYTQLTQATTEARKNIQKEKSEREKAVEELSEKLENSDGVFTTIEETENGGSIFYLHNKPNLSDSDMVWKMTAEAWSVSTDGGKTWNAGMTVDGDTIVRILEAVGVNANWIKTGRLEVKDSKENTLFLVDMDTKEVNIEGSHISIGGKPLNEVIVDTKTIVLSLDNYYQSVGVDNQGSYENFPIVSIKPSVHYGFEDITKDCVFTVEESDNVTGYWNNQEKTYMVTGLTADNGWVDITATYLNRFLDVKRFTLAKVYAGKDGRTYILESSAQVVKVSKNNSAFPYYIDFYSKYQDGKSANRYMYKGRFRIRETADGYIWRDVYESEQDEYSVRHNLYTFILDDNGNPIMTSDENCIGTHREIVQIEVTLYDSGGFDTMIGIQNVVVVKDVDALSPNQVFDILTDNGKIHGIFKEGNQLFINADYIATGILTDLLKQNYWNLETGDFSLSPKSASGVIERSTQEDVFNKFTDNGKVQLIKMVDGQMYINASYIQTGKLKIGGLVNDSPEILVYDDYGSEIGSWTKKGLTSSRGSIESSDTNQKVRISSGHISFYQYDEVSSVIRGNGYARDSDEKIGRVSEIRTYMEGMIFSQSDHVNSHYDYVYNIGFNPNGYTGRHLFWGGVKSIGAIECSRYKFTEDTSDIYIYVASSSANGEAFKGVAIAGGGLSVSGSLRVYGEKQRIVETENYGSVGLSAVESPEAHFVDYGSGIISEFGSITIFLDPVFLETIDIDCNYQVFITKTSNGDINYVDKKRGYFAVYGENGTTFDWSVVCKQRDYEAKRLEIISSENEKEVDFDESIFVSDGKGVALTEEMIKEYERGIELL